VCRSLYNDGVIGVVALIAMQAPNTLSAAEQRQGWKLLFDGRTTHGWHNFKAAGVGPGWTVKDGVLTSEDPGNAGDIVTDQKFDWFELLIDFNFAKGQNSGVMYHVADDGDATWHSGPEVQIFDYQDYHDPQKTGWLYELYSSDIETTLPAGEWNHFRILVTPTHCETDVNGFKYYDYVLGSSDFWDRVKKSKFAEFPQFAKLAKGAIGIQGDHGVVSFRNIKIRPIKG
jgi:hypothetical protein